MSNFDESQKPIRLNYVSLGPGGRLTTVSGGRVIGEGYLVDGDAWERQVKMPCPAGISVKALIKQVNRSKAAGNVDSQE